MPRSAAGLTSPRTGKQPDFTRIIDPENLLLAYNKLRAEGGEAPGIDGLTTTTSAVGDRRRVADGVAVTRQRQVPAPTRPAWCSSPRVTADSGKLRLMIIMDRVVAKAVQ